MQKGIQSKRTQKGEEKMTVFDELKARGLLAQLTDEEEIKELINNGKATFYIGFDPTADSLHVGLALPAAIPMQKACAYSFSSSHPVRNPATMESPAPTPLTSFPFGAGASRH